MDETHAGSCSCLTFNVILLFEACNFARLPYFNSLISILLVPIVANLFFFLILIWFKHLRVSFKSKKVI